MQLIGKRVTERREQLRYTQQDIAGLCGLSRHQMYRIEHDELKKPVSQHTIETLADNLQCTPDYLTGDSDTPQTDAQDDITPFFMNQRFAKGNELYELAKRDFRFVNDLIYMQEHFSVEEINMVKQLVSFLRKNHERNAAIKVSATASAIEKDPE